jgi:hypothetical protein
LVFFARGVAAVIVVLVEPDAEAASNAVLARDFFTGEHDTEEEGVDIPETTVAEVGFLEAAPRRRGFCGDGAAPLMAAGCLVRTVGWETDA